jgi:hypothetical protein
VLVGDPALPADGQGGPGTVTTVSQHFDDPGTGGAWTVFKKFEGVAAPGPNHDNGDVWTWYYTAAPINTGANTVVNLGFKVGSLYDTVSYAPPAGTFDVGYDGFSVSNAPLTVPPGPGFNPPPTGGSGGGNPGGGGGGGGGGGAGGGSVRDNDNGDAGINDSCHCTIPAGGGRWMFGLAFLTALALFLARRR